MAKNVLITGITGQDGAYLAQFLLKKGYKVFGAYRRTSNPNFWRLQYLNIFNKINLVPVDMSDATSVYESIKISNPDEIYHLAAQSFVGSSFDQPISTANITGLATTLYLEAIRLLKKDVKFYQASTSELYGHGAKVALNEDSSLKPSSPYATAKLYAHWMAKIYREGYGIFASCGILFNHESPLRGLEFVTRKITNAVAKISLGLEKNIVLGNLKAKRDWGYAPEYVKSMWLMLQQKEAGDFVIATDETHTVEEFAEKAFRVAGLNWKKYVKTDKRFARVLDVDYLKGDYSKAKRELGWKPKVKFEELVGIMVREDIERWQKWQRGERFAFDAPYYPGEGKIITRRLSS